MSEKTTTTDDLLLATHEVEIQAKGKTAAVRIVAYSGSIMSIPGWGPLVIDLAGIDLSAPQISILADHDATLKGIVGHGRAEVRNGKLIVSGMLTPSTEAARQVIELAKSGFLFQASVGVEPGEMSRVRAGELIDVNGQAIRASEALTLVKSSTLREVSIVAIGADGSTSVTIAASTKGNESMTEQTVEEIREQAAAETDRINAIRAVCDGQFGDIEAQAIREGWDEPKVQLAVLRASRPKAPALRPDRPRVRSQSVIEAAILAHMGHEDIAEKHLGPQAAQQARDMRVTSLVDLCRAALQLDGRTAPPGREALIRAALSTYSLPAALGDAANKVLLTSYTESPASWRTFASIKSANNFKDHTGVRPSHTGDLEEVPPGGELKHGSVKEQKYAQLA